MPDKKETTKLKTLLKFTFIGLLHATVFLWLIPSIVISGFGGIGSNWIVIIITCFTIMISVLLIIYPLYVNYMARKTNN